MGYKFFDIEIRDCQLLPLHKSQKSKGWQLSQNDKLFIHFDLDGYKQIRTEPIEYPWKWNGYVQRTLYLTQWHNLLQDKSLKIYCTKYRTWKWSDEIIATAEIDLFTLATSSKVYEIQLLHPTHRNTVCIVKFNLSMIQITENISIKLRNVNVTSAYHRLKPILEKHQPVNVFCGYIDPVNQQWQLKYYPIQLHSLNHNTNPPSVMIRELKVKIPIYVLASNFLKGSVHLVFWRSKSENSNEIDSKEELGRIVMPILGNYDFERPNLIISERILWNVHNLRNNGITGAEVENAEDEVSAKISYQNGPRWMQLQNGKYSSHEGIVGKTFIGFPTPNIYDVDVNIAPLPISQFIQEHSLCLEQLKLLNYDSNFPEWFLERAPNKALATDYDYYEAFPDQHKHNNDQEIQEVQEQNIKQNSMPVKLTGRLSPQSKSVSLSNKSISDHSMQALLQSCDDFGNELQKYKTNRWHLLQMFHNNQLTLDEYIYACNFIDDSLYEKQCQAKAKLNVEIQQFYALSQ